MKTRMRILVACLTSVLYGAMLVGGVGFYLGFLAILFGPILPSPGSDQEPLLNVFITGPGGIVLGTFAGLIYGLRWRQTPARDETMIRIVVTGTTLVTVSVYAFLVPAIFLSPMLADWVAPPALIYSSCGIGIAAAWCVWAKTGSRPRGSFTHTVQGAVLGGAIGLAAGFLAAIMGLGGWGSPSVEEGSMISFLFTYPSGLWCGAVVGLIHGFRPSCAPAGEADGARTG